MYRPCLTDSELRLKASAIEKLNLKAFTTVKAELKSTYKSECKPSFRCKIKFESFDKCQTKPRAQSSKLSSKM